MSRYTAGPHPLVLSHHLIRGNRYFVKISVDNLSYFKRDNSDDPILDLLTTPYWSRFTFTTTS